MSVTIFIKALLIKKQGKADCFYELDREISGHTIRSLFRNEYNPIKGSIFKFEFVGSMTLLKDFNI